MNQLAHFLSMRGIDCLDNMQYDHAYFAQGQYSLEWVVEKTTTILTNPVFFLKRIDDAFQAHLWLLSIHA